jgi:hypothetical protein
MLKIKSTVRGMKDVFGGLSGELDLTEERTSELKVEKQREIKVIFKN